MKLKKHNVVSEPPFSNQSLMGSPIDERRAEVQQLAKRFDDRLRLARASELASWGHLLEAESLLCPGRHLPMSADELDLLARIHVKQGRFDQAKRRWEDAAKIGDRRAEFEECLKVLDDWLVFRKRTWIWRIRLAMCAVALLLSVWILVRLWFPFTT
jgi:hypothetical protein